MMYREAALQDCERVYALICELEGRKLPFDDFCEIYRDQLNSKYYYCLLAEKDNAVLGVLNLRFEKQLHHAEWIAEVMEFVVSSACRGQGIGRQMLEKAARIAKEYGCKQIEAACNQLRTDTHRFYLREGMNHSHYKFTRRLDG